MSKNVLVRWTHFEDGTSSSEVLNLSDPALIDAMARAIAKGFGTERDWIVLTGVARAALKAVVEFGGEDAG